MIHYEELVVIKSMRTLKLTAGTIITAIFLGMIPVNISTGLADAESTSDNSYTFISPEKEAPMPFTSLGMKWSELIPEGTSAEIMVRFNQNGVWTEWNDMNADIDSKFPGEETFPTSIISTNLTKTFQYKIIMNSGITDMSPVISNIEFTYINAKDKSAEPKLVSWLSPLFQTANAASSLNIISRSSWGANEGLRVYKDERPEPQLVKLEDDFYKKYADELKIVKSESKNSAGELLTWPVEYPAKVSKIIIHHTATTKNLDNPKQAIRDIYYWHAISRGWGDIGYNYIIDTNGNIYHGRYGGEGVVGAHAGKANVGSIGIAVLGNYQEDNVPTAVYNSLATLIKDKAALHGINIAGYSSFRGENLPNLIGHRDVMSTSCPGINMYTLLPKLRQMEGGTVARVNDFRIKPSEIEQYNFELSKDPGIIKADANTKSTIDLVLKNTGTSTWNKSSYVMLSNNGIYEFLKVGGLVKSGIAGKDIKPGSTVTFKIPIETAHASGMADLEVFPMINGTKKIDKYIEFPIQINPSKYDYDFVSLSLKKNTLKAGERTQATLTLKNTGTVNWEKTGANSIKIGTEKPRDHISRIALTPGTRIATLVESTVKPGEEGHFVISIKAPMQDGYYEETFAPVIEGVTWLPIKGEKIMFYVGDGTLSGKVDENGIYYDFTPGQTRLISFKLNNTGLSPWNKTGKDSMSFEVVKSAGLTVTDVQLAEDSVKRGESGTINLKVRTSNSEGKYRVIITPRIGITRVSPRPIVLFINTKLSAAATLQTSVAAVTKSISAAKSNDKIRIGLGFDGNPKISANGAFKLFEGSKELASFVKDEPVLVTYAAGKYSVKSSKVAKILTGVPRFEPVSSAILRIDNYENHPSWKPELNDNQYRGTLEVNYYQNKLVVVNELDLESYLRGLAEISASDPYEKIKAVIVLARSYAKYYMTIGEKFPGAPYHLSDDPAKSQYYIGYSFEIRNTTGVRAVNDTAGEVVTYNGTLIKTPYFSSDDGRTRSAEEVWGWKDTPYLVSVDDPGCKGQQMRGHGVGLSGCGSKYLAEQGKKYQDIIKYYFKGVEIEKQ